MAIAEPESVLKLRFGLKQPQSKFACILFAEKRKVRAASFFLSPSSKTRVTEGVSRARVLSLRNLKTEKRDCAHSKKYTAGIRGYYHKSSDFF